ncbi:hypothetical protein Amsp01_049440 [Amycolatopsis sp. NBRC 101858]|uniref:EthD domain-containing protein n=1 Tax=Amycolatopsis sp. NBRC 101858 TaxID=3032200 RepID=UPI0024A56958|nr:EthD domain-containing protein [Amycolatopsis sp. NBRC 101858]GLY38920.1 hypothetical protein Amsp01_049440 [Amycolatopsis sp. NBRC 101858]
MIKIVAMLKRRPDLTLDDFSRYYEREHAPLFARTIPPAVDRAIVHYVQNHAVVLGDGRAEPPYDCVTEIGFADLAGMRLWSAFYNGPDGAVLREDEERFMDTSKRVVVVTEARFPVER